MVKQSVDCSDFRSSSSSATDEVQRISFTIQCSSPKSKWVAKWTSLSIVSKLGNKPRIPAFSASLRAKLPRAAFKLSLAVKSSVVSKGNASPFLRKTVKFFGIFKAKKVCVRLSWCLRKLKAMTFLQTGSDSGGGGVSHGGVGSLQSGKLVEHHEQGKQQKVLFAKSASELGRGSSSSITGSSSSSMGQPTGLLRLLGNPSLLFHYLASEKERWGMVVRAGVVLSTLMLLLNQLGIIRVVWSAAFKATASVVVVGSVLHFFGDNNKLSTALWKLWVEPINGGGIMISPQVMWTTVEPFIRGRMPSRLLVGTSALSMIILFQLSASSWGSKL